ncbi:unnamed protein product [Phytomonas sp. Hart1]|nr:unnamed protein product [Phytomonas sp. Hart1]|eukprot:CCW69330.1 unnamed protein product [Phytomonas sp. isolate Hart1]
MFQSQSRENGKVEGATSTVRITKDTIQSLNYYEIFHLPSPVSTSSTSSSSSTSGIFIDAQALQRAYRRYSLLFHPDKDPSPEAREAFERVKIALDTLIDSEKRSAYDASLRKAEEPTAGGANSVEELHRKRQAEKDAKWAEFILKQKENQRAASEDAKRRDIVEREETMQRIHAELTSSLETPFKQMEREVVSDWDVDAELLQMKLQDVEKLLQEIRLQTIDPDDDVAARWKRRRREKVSNTF